MSLKLTPRKAPKQGRAKATVEAMLEAAVRLSRSSGLSEWTTNQVAELAGVSIGTLYQYFPSKESLITSMATQRREERLGILATKLETALSSGDASAPAEAPGAIVAGALVPVYGAEPALDAELERYLLAIGAGRKLAPFDQKAASLVAGFLRAFASDAPRSLRRINLIARAAVSVMAAIAIEEPAALAGPDLLIDVAALIDGALARAVMP